MAVKKVEIERIRSTGKKVMGVPPPPSKPSGKYLYVRGQFKGPKSKVKEFINLPVKYGKKIGDVVDASYNSKTKMIEYVARIDRKHTEIVDMIIQGIVDWGIK